MASALWFTMASTTVAIHSNIVSRHIRFVTNMRHEQSLCITLDLIWRKQQVKGKIAFYFLTETCCLLQTKSNVCNLKKVFESHKTCSNAAHQLVDRFFFLCVLPMATNSGTINSKNKDYIIKDNSTLILSDQVDSLIS